MNTKEENEKNKRRLKWVDIAKGITIILVIIGHTVDEESSITRLLRGSIFSFHMPLFFILSAVTYKWAKNYDELINKIKKDCKHLLVPAMAVFIMRLAYEIYLTPSAAYETSFWRERLYRLVFASGIETNYAGFDIHAMGIPWFLVVLFIGRLFYNSLLVIFDKKQIIAISLGISLVGISLRILPFSIDIALAIQPFFAFGRAYGQDKKTDNKRKPAWMATMIFGVLWIVLLYITFPVLSQKTYLELAWRRYPLFPICFICAILGTMFICGVSKQINNVKVISSFFSYLGKYSLYILLVHCMDYVIPIHDLWFIENNQILSGIIRVIINFGLFFPIMAIRYCFRIFFKKQKGERIDGATDKN